MDIIEFVEKIYGIKLYAHQKEFLRMVEETRKKYGDNFKIIMGRGGNCFCIVAGKEKEIC